MGKHRAPESWLDQWLAMMREASMPVMHWTGAIVLHITAVWTYYEMTGH